MRAIMRWTWRLGSDGASCSAYIGMKIMAAGRLLQDRAASPSELIRYAASHADTVIIGCSSIAEVRENLGARSLPFPMPPAERAALEARVAPRAGRYDSFKA
ncbi:hypothetical protein BE20_47750 [Sorangium cellulosum]|nr:hypothetical protein BE20_47750 [Sorangium cellulosum]